MRYNILRISKQERNDAIRFYSTVYGHSVNSQFMKNFSIEYPGEKSHRTGAVPACNLKPGQGRPFTTSLSLIPSINGIITINSSPRVDE